MYGVIKLGILLATCIYACPSGEVFRDYKYLPVEIFFVRGNIFTPQILFFQPPQHYQVRRFFVSLHRFFVSLRRFLFHCADICFTAWIFYFTAQIFCLLFCLLPKKLFGVLRKLLSIPRILFSSPKIFCSSPKLLCHMRGFFVSSHFRHAVMP